MAEHVAVALLEGEVAMHEQLKHLQNRPPIYYPLVGGRTTCVGATLSRGTPKEDIGSRALAYLLWDCRRTLVPSFGDSARPFHSDASVLPVNSITTHVPETRAPLAKLVVEGGDAGG